MTIECFGLSNRGSVRERNEDAFAIGPFIERSAGIGLVLDVGTSTLASRGFLAAVADGMGGYSGGDVASWAALSALSEAFFANSSGAPVDRVAFVHSCIKAAQARVAEVLERANLDEAGTTVAGLALFEPDDLIVFHVGDSRVLRVSGGYARALTVDHTPVGSDVASGRMTEEQALADKAGSALTRSLGLHGNHEPDISALKWAEGDTFLIGSDGWHGLGRGLSADQIAAASSEPEVRALVAKLVNMAIVADGSDNVTAVAVRVRKSTNDDA